MWQNSCMHFACVFVECFCVVCRPSHITSLIFINTTVPVIENHYRKHRHGDCHPSFSLTPPPPPSSSLRIIICHHHRHGHCHPSFFLTPPPSSSSSSKTESELCRGGAGTAAASTAMSARRSRERARRSPTESASYWPCSSRSGLGSIEVLFFFFVFFFLERAGQ